MSFLLNQSRFLRLCCFIGTLLRFFSQTFENDGHPLWLVGNPIEFQSWNNTLGMFIDARKNQTDIDAFIKFTDYFLPRVDGFTDGENVDALEHFFWGQRNGLAIELGALDGSPQSRSQTYDYENSFNWKRILIDGNPLYRESMIKRSTKSFNAIAAICEKHQKVHFRAAEYVGGILEFMNDLFMKTYHKVIYDLGVPPGNISSIDWSQNNHTKVLEVDCMPLKHILHRAHVKHINYFILDVEGGELQVLSSINWNNTRFDVLCIETEESNRPVGFQAQIIDYLNQRGYKNVTGQVGRNTCKIYFPIFFLVFLFSCEFFVKGLQEMILFQFVDQD